MKPLINLKSFLAVLLILIVPAALIVAYFRNYSSEAPAHEHGEKGTGDGAATKMDGGKSGTKPDGEDHAAMGHGDPAKGGKSNAVTTHGNMAMPQDGQMTPQAESHQPLPKKPQKDGNHATSAQEQPSMTMSGTLPGIPGASHLHHVGSTDFFLDHPQHITLSIEQKKKLNQIKELARLNKASANRKVQEAEQQLWKLTAVKQPDTAQIETKVREIEKLHVAQRLAFIRSVGEAAKVLTEEQTKILLGKAAPVMPDAKPTTPGNKPAAETAANPSHEHKP
jgi:hypothetical protein